MLVRRGRKTDTRKVACRQLRGEGREERRKDIEATLGQLQKSVNVGEEENHEGEEGKKKNSEEDWRAGQQEL